MNAPSENTPASEPALLVLDASGIVRAANTNAGQLWQCPPADLAGQPVVSLFAFEIVSDDPSWRESQWEVLIATSLDRPLRLQAQPFEPVPAVDVTIELQTAHGPDSVYFARIRRSTKTTLPAASIPAPAPVSISVSTAVAKNTEPAGDTGPTLLASRGPIGFFDVDVRNGIVVTSPAWKRMLGYTVAELADTHEVWRSLIHPDDTAALPDHVGKPPLSGSRDFSVEFRLRHRLGHYIWVQSAGIQMFAADHTLERVIGVNIDISERKEIEEAGFASEDRLDRLADAGRLALFELDFLDSQHWFSPALAALTGEGDTPSIESLLSILPSEITEQGLPAYLNLLAPHDPYTTQAITLRPAEGVEIPALLGIHRQWSRKRELTLAIGFLLPLPPGVGTGPVPAPLLGGMLDALNEGVILADARARILHINAKASELSGWSLAAAREFKLNDVFKLVRTEDGRPDDSAVDLVLAAEEKPRLYSNHSLVTTLGASPIPIVWTTRQIAGPDGAATGIVVVFRNPQEMSLTPEEIIHANRFDAIGQLAGGIAHDFNNLLTTILGGISTAKDNRDYTKLEDAESACLAAKSLTRQLLTFAKGGNSAAHQVIAVNDILHDAVRIAAAGTTAVVTVDVPEGVSPINVDRSQIIQIFQNLIINALQAMPDVSKGIVQLRSGNVHLAENDVPPLPAGNYVQIEVQDNGSGIPSEHIEKIFEPFYTTKKTGTGLGLSTVLSIIRQHGGQIGVDSTVGAGTTFTLFFPQAEHAVEVAARSAPALRFGTGRILFLDDDPKICELTAGMLTSLDYTHDIVRTGEDAITFYRRYLNIGRPYDVVILDLNVIGGMGGEECFRQLLALHPEVRAVVNSGYDSDELARRYMDMGFVGYLTKPYRVGDLARALKAALGKTDTPQN